GQFAATLLIFTLPLQRGGSTAERFARGGRGGGSGIDSRTLRCARIATSLLLRGAHVPDAARSSARALPASTTASPLLFPAEQRSSRKRRQSLRHRRNEAQFSPTVIRGRTPCRRDAQCSDPWPRSAES